MFSTAHNAVDKMAIARCFSRAAQSYDQHAGLQRLVGDKLLSFKPPSDEGRAFGITVDLGCGSGALLPALSHGTERLIAIDLAFAMLQQARAGVQQAKSGFCAKDIKPFWLNADAESLPLQDNSIDCCVSNLALQWCNDLTTPLREIKRCLKPGGYLVFSTLTQGSLDEVQRSWAAVDNRNHINEFLHERQIHTATENSGLNLELIQTHNHTMLYPDVRTLLQGLKGVGANHVHQKDSQVATRKQLLAFKSSYESRRNADGMLPLTYKITYCLLCKK